ncbi:MAG: MoaD/ThiS family protein [Planctomycetota bacterium]
MAKPARAELILPIVLEPVTGRERLEVRGRNVAEALESAFEQVPLLRHHLTEEGKLRAHVLCLHNGSNLDRDQLKKVAISDGDELVIHQAISGG